MGRLVDGVWQREEGFGPERSDGRFARPTTQFRSWVTPDGAPGPTGEGGFRAEAGRYHLYVAHACPWCHRVMLVRALKGLQQVIPVSVVDPYLGDDGWLFSDAPGTVPDTVHGARYVHELYARADPHYTGRATVPVLWDEERDTIVSNESADLMRMLGSAFDAHAPDPGAAALELVPDDLRGEIEALNEDVYRRVNNGVYKAGFATSQEAYEEAFDALFDCLDGLEARLERRRYLLGERITEADWRLFPTLLRFEPVYHYHFKCNRHRLRDYPSLWGHTLELYGMPGVAETVNLEHIKRHYFTSHPRINPTRVVPKGPAFALDAPHGRDALPGRPLYPAP